MPAINLQNPDDQNPSFETFWEDFIKFLEEEKKIKLDDAQREQVIAFLNPIFHEKLEEENTLDDTVEVEGVHHSLLDYLKDYLKTIGLMLTQNGKIVKEGTEPSQENTTTEPNFTLQGEPYYPGSLPPNVSPALITKKTGWGSWVGHTALGAGIGLAAKAAVCTFVPGVFGVVAGAAVGSIAVQAAFNKDFRTDLKNAWSGSDTKFGGVLNVAKTAFNAKTILAASVSGLTFGLVPNSLIPGFTDACDAPATALAMMTEAPATVAEAPTPAPVTEAPAPAAETPTPAPVTEAPAPVTEAPAPVTETPAPVTETPAPVTETPITVAEVSTEPVKVLNANILLDGDTIGRNDMPFVQSAIEEAQKHGIGADKIGIIQAKMEGSDFIMTADSVNLTSNYAETAATDPKAALESLINGLADENTNFVKDIAGQTDDTELYNKSNKTDAIAAMNKVWASAAPAPVI